jgi:sulfur carrier protein
MSEATTVQVNGEHWPWQPGLQVAQIIESLEKPANSVATALNGHFVPRSQREHTPLKPGDVLTVFQAIVGG